MKIHSDIEKLWKIQTKRGNDNNSFCATCKMWVAKSNKTHDNNKTFENEVKGNFEINLFVFHLNYNSKPNYYQWNFFSIAKASITRKTNTRFFNADNKIDFFKYVSKFYLK